MRASRKELEIEINRFNRMYSDREKITLASHFENEGLVIEGYVKQGTFTLGRNLKTAEAVNIIQALDHFCVARESNFRTSK